MDDHAEYYELRKELHINFSNLTREMRTLQAILILSNQKNFDDDVLYNVRQYIKAEWA